MTRWKREPTTALITMHAHNLHSRWNDFVLQAAAAFGLLVGYREFRNCSGDGSWDSEWFVMGAQLERVGGTRAVHDRAHELADEWHAEQKKQSARALLEVIGHAAF
jgi:hypothetical protein